jgi:hypothetical protein
VILLLFKTGIHLLSLFINLFKERFISAGINRSRLSCDQVWPIGALNCLLPHPLKSKCQTERIPSFKFHAPLQRAFFRKGLQNYTIFCSPPNYFLLFMKNFFRPHTNKSNNSKKTPSQMVRRLKREGKDSKRFLLDQNFRQDKYSQSEIKSKK